MDVVTKAKVVANENIDKKIVVSSMIGAALLGVVTFVAVKSGVKPLAKAAKVAKNGGAK